MYPYICPQIYPEDVRGIHLPVDERPKIIALLRVDAYLHLPVDVPLAKHDNFGTCTSKVVVKLLFVAGIRNFACIFAHDRPVLR